MSLGPFLVVPCPACGQKNRIDRSRLFDVPVCGRCKTRLLERK